VCGITGAATIGLAPSSHAVYYEQFQSPSGDISCNLVNYPPTDPHAFGKNFVQCDIANHNWVHPQPPPPGRADVISTVVLMRGQVPIVGYRPGTFAAVGPMLDPAHTPYGGAIACSSEQPAIKCTDASTGHFFRVSRDSYELG
jgi:hypothetical protein